MLKRGEITGRLSWLDCLRFSAALAVVSFHWLYTYRSTGKIPQLPHNPLESVASYGYLGVHLFFLISGFVISNSAQGKTPSQFAVGRATRLYPAFWAAVIFTSLMWTLWGTAEKKPSMTTVLGNLTMVPGPLGQPLVDPSYWTLLHELCFYALVGALLLLGAGHWLDDVLTGWAYVLLFVAVAAPAAANVPFIGALYSLFAGGAVLSAVHRKGWSLWRLGGVGAALTTSILYVLRTTADRNIEASTHYSLSATVTIICAFYLLIGAQTMPRVAALELPGSQPAAALTYPVYLVHHATGFVILYHFATPKNAWWLYPAAFALMLAIAQAVHVLVEKRLRVFWRTLFEAVLGRPISWATRGTSHASRLLRVALSQE